LQRKDDTYLEEYVGLEKATITRKILKQHPSCATSLPSYLQVGASLQFPKSYGQLAVRNANLLEFEKALEHRDADTVATEVKTVIWA